MSLENLGKLNKLYNFQDTIILTEILEQISYDLQKLFKFNPKISNSASSFSGCIHRYKSKCLIASPTEAKHVKLFEKTLIGGFSCVKTRLDFDLQLLLHQLLYINLQFDVQINLRFVVAKKGNNKHIENG